MEIQSAEQEVTKEGEGRVVYLATETVHTLDLVVKQQDLPALEAALVAIMSPEPPEGREPEPHEVAVPYFFAVERHGDEALCSVYPVPDDGRLVHLEEIAKILEVAPGKPEGRSLKDAWYEAQQVGEYAPPPPGEETINGTG